jgi:hypothetical protein
MNQPGLTLRMRREARIVSAQHRQLDDFTLRVACALARREPRAARAAFARFADALEAHFALEEALYFPALRGLRPTLAAELSALEEEHRTLREQLAALGRPVATGTCSAASAALGRLAEALAEHEGREESLLDGMRRSGEDVA